MDHKIAVFIDGDNISYKDIHLIMDEIKTHGSIIYNSLFCDMSDINLKNMQETCIQNGISLIHCERISKKNSTDIKLIVELMKILHTNDMIDLFYIITSDSDFRHVIPHIREKGKLTYCIGNEQTNNSLQKICQKFTTVELLHKIHGSDDIINITELEPQHNEIVIDTNEEEKSKKKESEKNINKNKEAGELKKIHQEIMNLFDEKEILDIGTIRSNLQNKYNFDYRNYNCSSMTIFIQKHYKEFIFIRPGTIRLS
tara:strand:- start:38 stop:805 length:768 start_codon:yes stop_codon:yes gene_type:complete